MSAKPHGLPSLSINKNADEVDSDREKYNLNSPGATDTPDADKMSPNTARKWYGVNSPKAEQGEVGSYENATAADEQSGIAGFVTQVPRDQPKAKTTTAPEDLMTQVPRPESGAKAKKKTQKKKGGWCSCFSPTPDVDEANMQPSKGRAPTRNNVSSTAGATVEETPEDIAREERGLLGRRKPEHRGKKTIVLDLDETLVHSSFKPVKKRDFIVPVEIEGNVHNVYVLVRPGAAEFLDACARHYEVVLFTASLSKYADPLLDTLDKKETIDARLFRESCVQIGYSYVKDLTKLGRKMEDIMIVDNSPQSYRFQPQNAIPITSWFDDPNDTELFDILPCLETTLVTTPDVRNVLDANKSYAWLCQQGQKQ